MSCWVSTGAASNAAIGWSGKGSGVVIDVRLRSIVLPGILVLGRASIPPADIESEESSRVERVSECRPPWASESAAAPGGPGRGPPSPAVRSPQDACAALVTRKRICVKV